MSQIYFSSSSIMDLSDNEKAGYTNDHVSFQEENEVYYEVIDVEMKELVNQNASLFQKQEENDEILLTVTKPYEKTCHICFKELSSQIRLQQHIKTKHSLKRYICDNCGKVFANKNYLRLHMYHHRKYFEAACKACGKKYNTNQSLRHHLRQHTEIYSCTICNQEFNVKKLLYAHIASYHNNNLQERCRFCARAFARKDVRLAHERSVHKNGHYGAQYCCKEDFCNQSFNYRNELTNHIILNHYKGVIFSCTVCEKKFKKKSLLQSHMNVHSKEKPKISCEICHQTFSFKTGLKKHMKRNNCSNKPQTKKSNEQMAEIAKQQLLDMSSFSNLNFTNIFDNELEQYDKIKIEKMDDEIFEANNLFDDLDYDLFYEAIGEINEIDNQNLFVCDICQADYKEKYELSQHMKDNHLEDMKNAIQSVCEYTCLEKNCRFKTRSLLEINNHIKNHKKSHRCAECGKEFKRKCELKSHEKIHSENKVYVKCQQCGKILLERSLNSHLINQHSEIANFKPFVCQICGKRERYEKILFRHINSVHNPKNRGVIYSCPDCNETFIRRRDLTSHSFQHYKGHIFACDICNKNFKKISELKIHMRVHQNILESCSKCNRKFKTSSGLKKHLKKHEIEED